MADDEFLGLGPLVQFGAIAVLGLVLLAVALLAGSGGSPDALLFGVGGLLVLYAFLGGGWTALVEALDLSERTQVAVVVVTGVVLMATNTVAGGVLQFVAGLVLLLYGGGLGVSYLT